MLLFGIEMLVVTKIGGLIFFKFKLWLLKFELCLKLVNIMSCHVSHGMLQTYVLDFNWHMSSCMQIMYVAGTILASYAIFAYCFLVTA